MEQFIMIAQWRVFGTQPIFAAIEMTEARATHAAPHYRGQSRTNRTARARTSGKNLFIVLLIMIHRTQELEPLVSPARFSCGFILALS